MFEFTAAEYRTAAKILTEEYPNSPWAAEKLESKAAKVAEQTEAARRLGYQAKLLVPGSSEQHAGTQLMKLLMDWGWTPPEELR